MAVTFLVESMSQLHPARFTGLGVNAGQGKTVNRTMGIVYFGCYPSVSVSPLTDGSSRPNRHSNLS